MLLAQHIINLLHLYQRHIIREKGRIRDMLAASATREIQRGHAKEDSEEGGLGGQQQRQ